MIVGIDSNPIFGPALESLVFQSEQIIEIVVIALFLVFVFGGEWPVEDHAVSSREIGAQAKDDL